MHHYQLALFTFFLMHYGLADAKLFDIHFRSAEEEAMLEREAQKREKAECQKILEDPDEPPERKVEAIERMLEKGIMG